MLIRWLAAASSEGAAKKLVRVLEKAPRPEETALTKAGRVDRRLAFGPPKGESQAEALRGSSLQGPCSH